MSLKRRLQKGTGGRRCHNDVGAPENRIKAPKEHVLTPRGNDIDPGTWTGGRRPPKKEYIMVTQFVNWRVTRILQPQRLAPLEGSDDDLAPLEFDVTLALTTVRILAFPLGRNRGESKRPQKYPSSLQRSSKLGAA